MTNFLIGAVFGTVGTLLLVGIAAWFDMRGHWEEPHQPPWPIIDGERDDAKPYRANVRGKRDGRL
jgi:hypothetical protein